MRWSTFVADGGVSWRSGALFDPGTMMMAGSMALTAAGTGLSAASTIAGGNSAAEAGLLRKREANYQADQLDENAAGEIGTAQRQMLDTQLKTKMLQSSLVARAAAGGVNAAVGSPLAGEKAIASRGTYQALMDLWNGQNRATGDQNEATALRFGGNIAEWEGQEEKSASRLNALSTIAGGGASMLRTYGAFQYPSQFGRPGVGYG